ncbi:transcriptional regulator [Pseudoalteromonas luteoviolacea B = ATCC 29581]|nr:transcriptional regulator [Pseudoalteromonas luteoviolacea B = ATCC 29581]
MGNKLQTQTMIKACAWTMFLEQGFEATTTRQIAKKLNIGNGTVFSHFKSKGDILISLFDEHASDLIHQAKSTNQQHSARLTLRHYATYLYPFYFEHKALSIQYFSLLILNGFKLSNHLKLLEHEIYQGQPFQKAKAPILIDSFVMTAIDSFHSPSDDVNSTLRVLSNKLQQIS